MKKVKLCLFADDMMLYIKDDKNSTRKLLEIINKLKNTAGYKISFHKSLASLPTTNKHTEEILETL